MLTLCVLEHEHKRRTHIPSFQCNNIERNNGDVVPHTIETEYAQINHPRSNLHVYYDRQGSTFPSSE